MCDPVAHRLGVLLRRRADPDRAEHPCGRLSKLVLETDRTGLEVAERRGVAREVVERKRAERSGGADGALPGCDRDRDERTEEDCGAETAVRATRDACSLALKMSRVKRLWATHRS